MPSLDPEAIRQGDRLALSRALTAVENHTPSGQAILSELFPNTGKAHLIGVTGGPGTGKSTLVNQLVKAIRQEGGANAPKVAVIAIDPTSPFTGGALLGDRIRMQDLAGDTGIFIRSMASRGALGGMSHSAAAFATLLDAAGFDQIFIETVGAGQSEVEIAQLAHTTLVVEAPGLGDDIQANKAGILEIADILVVNKADQPGAENTARALRAMLEIGNNAGGLSSASKHLRNTLPQDSNSQQENTGWQIPVRLVSATEGKGISELYQGIQAHRAYLEQTGLWQVKESLRLQKDLEALIQDTLIRNWRAQLDEQRFHDVLESVIQKKISPSEALGLLI